MYVKLFASKGQFVDTGYKGHTFTVPHDGAGVIARAAAGVAVNDKCLENFVVTFIGDKQMLRVLADRYR